jgi:hypothetical protein
MLMRITGEEVLRRRSFVIGSWCLTLFFLIIAAALLGGISHDGWTASGPIVGVAACFGTLALCRRITGSRVVLRENSLVVVNAVFYYEIPYRSVARVSGSGTLTVKTVQQDEVASAGFGGSLIDKFLRSSEKAAGQIRTRLPGRPDDPRRAQPMHRGVTPSWPADVCAVLAVVFLVIAGVVGG